MYYPSSEKGGPGGYIALDDLDAQWNCFVSATGVKKGDFCDIVTGVGARSVRPYSPLTKSCWYILSDIYKFELVAGDHLGTLKVKMSDILARGAEMRELGASLLFFATRREVSPSCSVRCDVNC